MGALGKILGLAVSMIGISVASSFREEKAGQKYLNDGYNDRQFANKMTQISNDKMKMMNGVAKMASNKKQG